MKYIKTNIFLIQLKAMWVAELSKKKTTKLDSHATLFFSVWYGNGIYSTTIYLPTYRLTCYRIANIEGRASWYMVHYLLYNISSKIIHSSNCFYLVWYYYTVLSNILGIQLCILLYLIKTSCYKLITWLCHYACYIYNKIIWKQIFYQYR